MTNHSTKGSLVLKALSPSADEARIIAFLKLRAKSIPPEKIPELLQNLPVVLSRNVAEETGQLVVRRLEDLGAVALFVPLRTETANTRFFPWRFLDVSALFQRLAALLAQPEARRLGRWLRQVNKEIWIVLAMLAIAALLNYSLASRYLLLGLYTLPAVLSAYLFGRRQAVLTAFASILLVVLVCHFNPGWFDGPRPAGIGGDNQWYHIVSWGCMLLVTVYTMGSLYERDQMKLLELKQTYHGLLLILRHFIALDEETENHCFRVSIFATRIASHLNLDQEAIEDIRLAALFHDIGKLKLTRDILDKASRLSQEGQELPLAPPAGEASHLLHGAMGRILPLLLAHHDHFERREPAPPDAPPVPLGAHILALADAYDSLTLECPEEKALTPEEAKEWILSGPGPRFDPEVVAAFVRIYDRMEMELPSMIL